MISNVKLLIKLRLLISQTRIKKSGLPLFCLVAGLATWPIPYLLSRKRRSTQDLLSFHLDKFRRFYSVISIISVVIVSDSATNAAFAAAGVMVFAAMICNRIVSKRSVKIPWFLQSLIVLQACWLFYLIFTASGSELFERILAFLTCCLYLGSCLLILKKVSFLLREEKKAANSAG